MRKYGRRDFLRTAAAGAAGIAVLPSLAGLARADEGDEDADGERQFSIAVATRAGDTADAIILDGGGSFDDEEVDAEGGFTHFQFMGSPPLPVVAHGSWKATRLVKFTQFGSTYGSYMAGILDLLVDLHVANGLLIEGASMKVVSNLRQTAGIFTGVDPTGVRLSVPMSSGTLNFDKPLLGGTLFSAKSED